MKMSDCPFAYPTVDLFPAAAKNVIGYLSGDPTVDLGCAVHCSYVILGCGLSAIPDAHPMLTSAKTKPLSLEECKAQLKAALESAISVHAVGDTTKINWLALLPLLLQILTTIFVKPAA